MCVKAMLNQKISIAALTLEVIVPEEKIPSVCSRLER